MPIDPSIIIICSIFLVSSICVAFAYSIYQYIKRLYYIKNFKEYISVLEYHMDKAYDIIHKDRILAFSLDAYRVPDEEYEGEYIPPENSEQYHNRNALDTHRWSISLCLVRLPTHEDV